MTDRERPGGLAGLLSRITTGSDATALRTSLTTIGSSLAAVLIALTISAVLLAVAGKNPFDAYATIVETGASGNKLLEKIGRAHV